MTYEEMHVYHEAMAKELFFRFVEQHGRPPKSKAEIRKFCKQFSGPVSIRSSLYDGPLPDYDRPLPEYLAARH